MSSWHFPSLHSSFESAGHFVVNGLKILFSPVTAVYHWWSNPIYNAVKSHDLNRLNHYIAQGYDVNKLHSWTKGFLGGDTPLNLAVQKGYYHEAKALLLANANPNLTVSNNPWAWHSPLYSVVNFINKYADKNFKTDVIAFPSGNGNFPSVFVNRIPLAYEKDILPKFKMAKLLIEHGADLQALSDEKNYMHKFLGVAILENDVQTAKTVIENFPNLTENREYNGRIVYECDSMLLKALDAHVVPEMVKLLVDKGIHGNSATLMKALDSGSYEKASIIVKALMHDPKVTSFAKATILDLAKTAENTLQHLQTKEAAFDALEKSECAKGKHSCSFLNEDLKQLRHELTEFTKNEFEPIMKMKGLIDAQASINQPTASTPLNISDVLDVSSIQENPSVLQTKDVFVESTHSSHNTNDICPSFVANLHQQELAPQTSALIA